MKDKEYYLNEAPFELPQKEKEALFSKEMNELTRYHCEACKPYSDICRCMSGEGNYDNSPYLPVTIFKDLELRSVPEESIVRRVTSSGTTGQKVSKIFLDGETAASQQRALCMITGDFIGGDRIPMLIIDTPEIVRNRAKFSARVAGIMGFSIMASRRFYALDENMNLDWESIRAFQEAAAGGPSFAFGFTFIIWQYFYRALAREENCKGKELGSTKDKLDLSNCHLIHGGGWKKLQNESVSDEEFRRRLREVCNIKSVSDYYGMAEQTGSIFMQCEEGHLHASVYSDISILDPEDFSPCEDGQWGLVALESFLPKSYPGHKLLTEDWGRILGVDDCPCGRKGKYFEISGRIKKAEVRGCSDTFESKGSNLKPDAFTDEGVTVKAGTYPPKGESSKSFSQVTRNFIDELSILLTRNREYRQYPEIYAFGFWIRKSHIDQLAEIYKSDSRQGKGLGIHIAPSNMPTMFAYSWICSLLAGNSNVVRLSTKELKVSEVLLGAIESLLDKDEYIDIRETNAFVQFPHEHGALSQLSMLADFRVIWGGDETVKAIGEIPKAEGCIDIAFPDKYSVAMFSGKSILAMDEEELKHKAHLFYNDTYGADHNACSSPKTVFWLDDCENSLLDQAKERWWTALSLESENYNLEPWITTEKYRTACLSMAVNGTKLGRMKKWTNRLYVIPCVDYIENLTKLESKFGIFYEIDIKEVEDAFRLFGEKVQTVVELGLDGRELWNKVREHDCLGVDRVVSVGEALEFNVVWDRKDLINIMSTI